MSISDRRDAGRQRSTRRAGGPRSAQGDTLAAGAPRGGFVREHGLGGEEILADLRLRQSREPSVHGARLFGLVYPTGRADLETLLEEVNRRYLFGNALNPFKFAQLAALEREVIDGVGALLHVADEGGGAMTSGGTESILMSMPVNRERA